MAEEPGRPGTSRSNVGCDAIEEPCTSRIVPLVCAGSPATLFQRKSLTSPLSVQCSVPRMRTCTFMCSSRFFSVNPDVVRLDEFAPSLDLRRDVGAELVRAHDHRIRALPLPGVLDIRPRQDLVDLGIQALDDLLRGAGRR